MDIDDILGQQQDDIIRGRFNLNRAKEQNAEFAQCDSLFDICRRMIELGDEPGVRQSLSDGILLIAPNFDARPWVERLLEAVRNEAKSEFEQTHKQAINSASFSRLQ